MMGWAIRGRQEWVQKRMKWRKKQSVSRCVCVYRFWVRACDSTNKRASNEWKMYFALFNHSSSHPPSIPHQTKCSFFVRSHSKFLLYPNKYIKIPQYLDMHDKWTNAKWTNNNNRRAKKITFSSFDDDDDVVVVAWRCCYFLNARPHKKNSRYEKKPRMKIQTQKHL